MRGFRSAATRRRGRHVKPSGWSGIQRLLVVTLAPLLALTGIVMLPTAAFADDDPTSVLGLTKSTVPSPAPALNPGEAVNYRVELVCSNLEPTGCLDAALTDVVPAPLVLDLGSISVSGASAADTSSGNTIQLAFTQPIFGGVGLDDGTSVVVTYSATLPTNVSGDWNGVDLVNTAVFTAANAVNSGLSRAAVVTPNVPLTLVPGITKSFAPTSAPAVPGAPVALTINAWNASNQSVDTLTVQDPKTGSPNPFQDTLRIIGISQLTPPTGADRVAVQWLDATAGPAWVPVSPSAQPIPADLDDLLIGAPASADILGARLVFSNSTGTIPVTAPGGEAAIMFDTVLRDGVTADPLGTTIENTAIAQVTKNLADSGPVDAAATLTLQQATLGPILTKSFDSHRLVPGESTVASLESGNGDYPIVRMDVTEPAVGSKNLLEQGLEFDGFVDADVEWPSGATDAVFSYFYDDALPSTPVPLTAPDPFPVAESGRTVTGFTVSYTGPMPPRAYAAIPFTVVALPVVGLLDVTETNVAWAELERGDGLDATVTANDSLTRTPARINTTVDKQIIPGDIWSVPGTGAVIAIEARVNTRIETPDSTVGAQSLSVSDPALPSGTIDGFWDRFDLQAIAPTAVPANATVTANWWNGTAWMPIPGATAVGPVSGWTFPIPAGIRDAANFGGIQLVFEPTMPSTLLQPGFTVAPYFQVTLRSDLRSTPGTPAVDPNGPAPVPVDNVAQSRVENSNADPVFAIDDDPAQIIVNPTVGPGPGPGPGSPLADKEWIDPVGDPSQIQARTANDATARLFWTTSGLPLDRAVVSDPAPISATATDLPAVATTVFDAFDLVSIAPINNSSDPSMKFDAVTGVFYFSDTSDSWVDITSTVCSPASACDGAFPGYTLSPTERADALGVRLVFEESPTRASRITGPLDPAVGSGVARSNGFRPIDLTFEIRDDKRSDGSAVTGRATYNAGVALVDNTVRVDGWIDTTSYSTVADDDIMILDVPLNVDVTKGWDQTELGLPPAGSADNRYPLATATIVATNGTAARVDTLRLTDPNPSPVPPTVSAFEYLNLYQVLGVTVPTGVTSSQVLITYATDPLNPVSYTIAAAQALAPATLADAIAITVRHDGRIDAGASTELQYVAQLRAEERTSGAPLIAGTNPDNTVRAWVTDPGGTAGQAGEVLDDANADIDVVAPTYDVAAFKTITPESRNQEESARNVTVELSGQPAGTVRTLEMTYTDADPRFWNAYDFTGFLPTTLAVPITRIKVEALVGVAYVINGAAIDVTCGGIPDLSLCWMPVDTKVGASGSTVTLDSSLIGSLSDVRGLRYTIDRADGANWERPYNARQRVQFTADRRVNLLIGPSGTNVDPVPSTQPFIPATPIAPGETVLGRTSNELQVEGVGGWPRQITPTPLEWREDANADDYTELLHQQNAVRIVKTPTGNVSPGTTIPFQIAVTNTGAWAMTGVEIVDTIETDGSGARLVIPATVPGDPAVFKYVLKNDTGAVQPAPNFTATPSVALDTITFAPVDPAFALPSGWALTITANLEVRGDIPANSDIANGAVITTDRLFDACVGAVNGTNQPVLNNVEPCSTTTSVHTVAASPLQIIKGVRGDGGGVRGAAPTDANYDDLGVLAYTGAPSTAYCEDPNWDPDATPGTGDEYYRTPCVPITRPGGDQEWRVDVQNSGNIPSVRLAMIDVLPSYGDRGVIIDQVRSSRWAPTFLGGLVVSVAGTTHQAGAVVAIQYLPTIPSTTCNRLDILSQMTGQPVGPGDLEPGEPASCITEVNGGRGWLTYDEASMSPADLAAVKALRIVVTYPTATLGEGLLPGEKLTIEYRSETAPFAERAETQDRESIAWNSIAGGALGVDPSNPGTPYASLIREPRKTGVAMALGKLELKKDVSTPGGWPFGSVMPDEYDFTLGCTSVGQDVPIRGLAGNDLSLVTLQADGTVLTVNNSKAAPDPEATDWSYVNLPLYADCTIVEEGSPGAEVSLDTPSVTALRDYATRSDVANPAWPTPLALQRLTATNTYSYTTFSVSKSVDDGPAVDENGTPIERPGPYQFTATCSFLGASALNTTFSLAPGGTWNAPTTLPAGASCTVTETTANGAGFATTDIEFTNGVVDLPVSHTGTKTLTFALEPDSTGVIDISLAFENTFGAGALRIDKAVAGAGAAAWGNATFTVDVVCTLASASPTTVYTGSFTLSKLTPSTPIIANLATGADCVVTETAAGGANTTGISPTTIRITNATATPQVVTVTNTFQVGTVRVTKALSGAPAASLAPATGHTYEFELACTRVVNGATETIAIPGGATRTVTGAGSADWTGLPTGALCTVTETDSGLATSTTLSPTGGIVTVGNGNGNVQTVTITNVFANGSLPVSKAVTGAGSAFAPTSFTATVTCTWHGANVPLPASGVITLTNGNTTTVTGVPVGSECSVAENDHGQTLPNPSSPTSVTVVADGGTPTTTLAVTNEYLLASLTVRKDVVTTSTPIPTEFAFSIVCTFNGATVLNTTFTLDDTDVRTFSGLPARAACTVIETDDRGADDTVVSGTSAGGVAPDQPTRTIVFASLSPDAAAAPVTQNSATYTNTFGMAGLSVTKHIEGGAAWRGSTETFPVDVYCAYGVDVLVDETVHLSAASPTVSWTSLVPGAVCDITETNAGDADVTTIAVDGGTATETMTTTVTLIDGSVTDIDIANWYLTGSVEVTKFFEDGAAGAKFGTRDYRVQLACTLAGEPSFTVPGGAIRTLNAAGPVTTYTGLPTGTACTLSELDTGGAVSTRIIDATTGAGGPTLVGDATAGWGFTIDTTGAALAATDDAQTPLGVVNRYEFAEVSATKTVDDGGALDALGNPVEYGPFEVTLTCTLDGVAIDPLESATQSFTTGGTVTWTELAVGADCIIEETDPADAALVELTVSQGGVIGAPVAATSVVLGGLSDATSGGNTVEVLNSYEAVSIEIEKRILGSDQSRAAGPYPVTLVCTLTDASHPAPGLVVRDVQGDIGGPSALTMTEDNLPAQASCVVTETDAGTANATSISFDGGPAVPSTRGTFILPLGLTTAATITVTNQFDLAFTGGSSGAGGMLVGLTLLLWGAAAVIGIAFWRRRRVTATA